MMNKHAPSGAVPPWYSFDLLPGERVEEGLARHFGTSRECDSDIALVRQPEDGYRYHEDVAYLLLSPRNHGQSNRLGILFLRVHSDHVEYCVCLERDLPHAFDCPRSLLERLDPPVDATARVWREQCWLRIRHPLAHGDIVTFHAFAPGLGKPLSVCAPYRVEWPPEARYPAFCHLPSGQRGCTPLWHLLPYTLHHLGEGEVQRETCQECGTQLEEPGAVCARCVPHYLERRAKCSEYVRALEAKLARASSEALWVPNPDGDGGGYSLWLLSPSGRGPTHRFSRIASGEGAALSQGWLGHSLDAVVQQAIEGGFPLPCVPADDWQPWSSSMAESGSRTQDS